MAPLALADNDDHDLAYSLGASLGERLRQEMPGLQLDALVERLRAVPRPGRQAPAWLLVDARARRNGEVTLQRALAERGEDDALRISRRLGTPPRESKHKTRNAKITPRYEHHLRIGARKDITSAEDTSRTSCGCEPGGRREGLAHRHAKAHA